MEAAAPTTAVPRHHFPRWLRALLLGIIAAATLLALIPAGMRFGLEYALREQGLEAVSIANIDFNVFTLRLKLEELRAEREGRPVLHVEQLQVRLAWRPLWQKQLMIESLALRGTQLDIRQTANARWRLAGIDLPPPASPADAGGQAPAWGVGLQQADMEGIRLELSLPDLTTSLTLDTLVLEDVYTWLPQQQARLHAEGRLNDSGFVLTAEAAPLAGSITAAAHLTLQPLDLTPFLALAPAGTPAVQARLVVDSDFGVRVDNEALQLTQQGQLGLHAVTVTVQPWRISGERLQWDGQLALVLRHGDLAALTAQGKAALQGAALADAQAAEALLTLSGMEASGIELRSSDDIAIETMHLQGLQVTLQRAADGRLLLPATKAAETAPPAQDRPGPALRIARIILDGDNTIDFRDLSLKPAFHQTLHITKAEITGIDNRAHDVPAQFQLSGRAGKYTAMDVRGEIRPFTAKTNLTLHSELKGLDLPPLTPYTMRHLGYNLRSGQLGATMELTIRDDMLDGNNQLRIHKLAVEPTDPAKMAQFSDQLKIPLATALYMLKDRNDNIALDLPISGNLRDPSFDISDAINTAMGKTMRLATVGYLKLFLQPYGGLLTLASMAGGAGSIQFEPLIFAPGLAVIEAQQQPYIDKIGALFKERPKLRLQLCGYATAADRPLPQKDKPPLEESVITTLLETLARQRAEAVKDRLINQHGVEPEQLFICHPAVDAAAAAQPRVELLL